MRSHDMKRHLTRRKVYPSMNHAIMQANLENAPVYVVNQIIIPMPPSLTPHIEILDHERTVQSACCQTDPLIPRPFGLFNAHNLALRAGKLGAGAP